MKFIVRPVASNPHHPPVHTLCILCSEDPRWCGVEI